MTPLAALEAVLFVAEEPVPTSELAEVLEMSTARVGELLAELDSLLGQRQAGVVLRNLAGGWRLYSHPDAYQYLER
ncbi:MAG TPA: SMC-Scp complex subunit ScpB, partial [Acidimicrobiia bacterium]